MTDVIHVQATIEQDGEVHLANLPLKRGQRIELSIRLTQTQERTSGLTAEQLLTSDVIGIWQNRGEIDDSATFARELREQAQHRQQLL